MSAVSRCSSMRAPAKPKPCTRPKANASPQRRAPLGAEPRDLASEERELDELAILQRNAAPGRARRIVARLERELLLERRGHHDDQLGAMKRDLGRLEAKATEVEVAGQRRIGRSLEDELDLDDEIRRLKVERNAIAQGQVLVEMRGRRCNAIHV